MASHIHLFAPGASITCVASDGVTGGRVVKVTAARAVAHTEATDSRAFGAAATDAAAGEDVLVLRGGVQNLVAAAAIDAGARVKPAAGGKVTSAGESDPGIGVALTEAASADALIQIALD